MISSSFLLTVINWRPTSLIIQLAYWHIYIIQHSYIDCRLYIYWLRRQKDLTITYTAGKLKPEFICDTLCVYIYVIYSILIKCICLATCKHKSSTEHVVYVPINLATYIISFTWTGRTSCRTITFYFFKTMLYFNASFKLQIHYFRYSYWTY